MHTAAASRYVSLLRCFLHVVPFLTGSTWHALRAFALQLPETRANTPAAALSTRSEPHSRRAVARVGLSPLALSVGDLLRKLQESAPKKGNVKVPWPNVLKCIATALGRADPTFGTFGELSAANLMSTLHSRPSNATFVLLPHVISDSAADVHAQAQACQVLLGPKLGARMGEALCSHHAALASVNKQYREAENRHVHARSDRALKRAHDEMLALSCDAEQLGNCHSGCRKHELVEQLEQFRGQVALLARGQGNITSQLWRECFRLDPFQLRGNKRVRSQPLPALANRRAFVKAITDNAVVIVEGATGSGKSTQLPQFLADAFTDSSIVCTQPRKLAAKTLADRVLFEFSGGTLATSRRDVCFCDNVKRKSKARIHFMTEAALHRVLLPVATSPDKANTTGFDIVVVDEAHERSMHTDLLLGVLKQLLPHNPRMRLVVTSATLDSDKFSSYFNKAPALKIPGRMFPVDEFYLPQPDGTNIATAAVEMAFDLHKASPPGDILVFLAAPDETEHARRKLEQKLKKHKPNQALVLALYGKQLPDDQRAVFLPAPQGVRKIVFATNVAETSVTIDGVTMVVDNGLSKELTSVSALAAPPQRTQTRARTHLFAHTMRTQTYTFHTRMLYARFNRSHSTPS